MRVRPAARANGLEHRRLATAISADGAAWRVEGDGHQPMPAARVERVGRASGRGAVRGADHAPGAVEHHGARRPPAQPAAAAAKGLGSAAARPSHSAGAALPFHHHSLAARELGTRSGRT